MGEMSFFPFFSKGGTHTETRKTRFFFSLKKYLKCIVLEQCIIYNLIYGSKRQFRRENNRLKSTISPGNAWEYTLKVNNQSRTGHKDLKGGFTSKLLAGQTRLYKNYRAPISMTQDTALLVACCAGSVRHGNIS